MNKLLNQFLTCAAFILLVTSSSSTIADTKPLLQALSQSGSSFEVSDLSRDKVTLTRAGEGIDLWRTDAGELVKLCPVTSEDDTLSKKNPSVSERASRSLHIQESAIPNIAQDGADSNESPNVRGNRKGRTFWPFTDWFYNPMFPPGPPFGGPPFPPPPMPYPMYPPPPPFGPPPFGPW